jgi:cellobiose-specific phosphotransferase system component IIB
MDSFFTEIYGPIIFKWLIYQDNKDGITISEGTSSKNFHTVLFKCAHYAGKITLWTKGIVEEEITNEESKVVFYLHFSFESIPHFMKMYREFYHALLKYAKERHISIAIVCSGGFTAEYFTDKIKHTLAYTSLPLSITSLAYYQLEDHHDFDAIYLAPQVYPYHYDCLKYQKPIFNIDPLIYGRQDTYRFLQKVAQTFQL